MMLTIAAAARASGLSAHALRHDERTVLLDPIDRYTDGDLERIRFLTKLRATGMAIREVRRYAHLLTAGEGNNQERVPCPTPIGKRCCASSRTPSGTSS